MPLDASIYGKNPLRSVADFEKEYADAELAKQVVADNKLKMLATQRAMQDDNALRQYYAKNDPSSPEFARGLGTINPKAMYGHQKSVADVAQTSAQTEKLTAETLGIKVANIDKKMAQHKSLLPQITTPEQMAQWIAAAHQDPDIGPIVSKLGPVDQMVARIPRNPQEFANFRLQVEAGTDKLRGQLATEARDLQTKLHQQEQEKIARGQLSVSQGHLGVAQGNLGLSRERLALDKTKATETVDPKKAAANEKAVAKYSETLQKHGIPEFESALSELEGQIAKYPVGKAPGLGRGSGLVPDWLQGAEGENLRQALAGVKNVLLKSRSGAAVTESELRRFVEELGSGGFRSEETLRKGIERIRTRFETVKGNAVAGVNDEVKSQYEERGGMPISRSSKSAGKVTDGWSVVEVKK
jgi:hypothetical protein